MIVLFIVCCVTIIFFWLCSLASLCYFFLFYVTSNNYRELAVCVNWKYIHASIHLSVLYNYLSIYLCGLICVRAYICNIYSTKTSNKFSVFRQNQNCFFFVPQNISTNNLCMWFLLFCAWNFAVKLEIDFDHFSAVRRSKILLSEKK